MTCRAFFEALPEGNAVGQRAALIDAAHPNGVCQLESVSEHSIAPVADEEYVFRYIFSPIHLEQDGSVKAAAFSDVSDKGLSCDRAPTAAPTNSMHERGNASAAAYNAKPENQTKEQRSYLGVVNANSAIVRDLGRTADGAASFAIYDTARADNRDHIDVFQIVGAYTPSQQKRIRKQLRDKFTRFPMLSSP